MTQTANQNLHELDFQAWIEDTLAKLKVKDAENLDWGSLIEEIESLGASQKKELESRLRVLLAHILKRRYVNSPYDYRGWENTIEQQRSELEILLKQSPSLKPYFNEIFGAAYAYVVRKVRQDYPDSEFPNEWQFSQDVEAILNEIVWENSAG